ncbi:lipopolysaccharide biosynthesis protein [Sphingomonas ginkgonis]|uniref:Lipopolysaccharide biosynthesis protein n=1 Tax=Sphingomonas ginkgonis TaxID=2315330 RepID=A0A429VEK4_9SPHN|nr:lipopolysaccharide biosynthesis protein [Sphingomonas ginkgonis]
MLGGKAGAGVISLVYLFLCTRFLGPRDYGVLILVHTYVTTVCGIVEFPSWQAIVRYGAEAQEGGQGERLARLLRFGARLELGGGVAALLTAVLLAPLVGPHLGWTSAVVGYAQLNSLAMLGSIRSTPAGYLQLRQRFDLLGWHNLVQPLIRLAGVLLVIAAGGGLRAFLLVWLAAGVAEFLVLWGMGLWVARAHLGPLLRLAGPIPAGAENPGLWRFLTASNIDVTLSELGPRAAPLMVGWILGPAAAGLFSVAQRGTVILAQPTQILGNTAYSELARLVAAGGGGAPLRRTLTRVIGWALAAVLPIVLLVAAFPTPIVRLIAGPAYLAAGEVMVLLVLARAIAVAGPPSSAALNALGRPALSMNVNLFISLVMLPVLPLLLLTAGFAGAGLQALLQSALATSLLLVMVWRTSSRL